MQGRPDEGLFVEFYMGTVQDPIASKTAAEGKLSNPDLPLEAFKGYPVFKEIPFCRIVVPGNKDEMSDGPAWLDKDHPRSHVNRFPHAWARFQNGDKDGVSGMPLKEWAACSRAHVEQLAVFKIRTVEQLASVSDGNLQHLGPGYLALRQKAQEFLSQANSNDSLKSELEALKAQIAALTAAKAPTPAMSAQIATDSGLNPAALVPAPAPKRRGRPPKASEVAAG